jgi:hypothetical protein
MCVLKKYKHLNLMYICMEYGKPVIRKIERTVPNK